MKVPRLLKTLLASTIYRIGTKATVLSGPSRGLRYYIFPDAGLAPIYSGWEPDAQAVMQKSIRSGSIVYDIGANYGVHTLLMARLVGDSGKVFSFEPVSNIAGELKRNVALNRFNNVTCIPIAVSDQCGNASFVLGAHIGAGKLALSSSESTFLVATITINEFVRSGQGPAPDFMKIDVEGAESKVLSGASNIMREHRPTILVDLHNPNEDRAVGRIFSDCDYDVFRTNNGSKVKRLDLGWPEEEGIWGQVVGVPRERL